MNGLSYLLSKFGAIGWLLIGRLHQAEMAFDSMLVRWPGDAYALASRSHVRAQLGRRSEAIADLRQLLSVSPQRSAADWFNLAFMLEESGEYAEAEAAFRQALSLDPKLDRAWYGLGLALVQLGRHDEAVTALKKNTELQPMSPYGWVQLARVQVHRAQPEEARKIIRHLRGFEPKVAAQLERETGLKA